MIVGVSPSGWGAAGSARSTNPLDAWTAWTAWPGHPAILPPEPRPSQADLLSPVVIVPTAPATQKTPTRSRAATVRVTPIQVETEPSRAMSAPRTSRRVTTPRTASATHSTPATARPNSTRTAKRTAVAAPHRVEVERAWPVSFDEWMIDIVRRRALRLNAGARRRGVRGTVRAVDLAHILDRTCDTQGRWICALCHRPVTLDDLSFDHVVALADGGEHAADNLVPAHRKCNEIKGSEKAQSREKALDRWLTEWSAGARGVPATTAAATASKSVPYVAARTMPAPSAVRRYA
ncbi:MAG TPA: HNH endonuclease [Ktedonobacterales bacterium]